MKAPATAKPEQSRHHGNSDRGGHGQGTQAMSVLDSRPEMVQQQGLLSLLGRKPNDFSRIPIFPDGSGASRTRAPNGEIDLERVTLNGGGTGPVQDGGDALPVPAALPLCCQIASGPTYTPSGNIPAVVSGTRKEFPFSMAATFTNQSPRAILATCCEVRQFIKWDARSAAGMGGPPHRGFPATTPADTWIEDRDPSDKRYGHRFGPHSDPIANGGDEYTTNGARDQLHGTTYNGKDKPSGPLTDVGKWFFRLDVIDTCNSNNVISQSPVITCDWG
jgi:hypothetical protein